MFCLRCPGISIAYFREKENVADGKIKVLFFGRARSYGDFLYYIFFLKCCKCMLNIYVLAFTICLSISIVSTNKFQAISNAELFRELFDLGTKAVGDRLQENSPSPQLYKAASVTRYPAQEMYKL